MCLLFCECGELTLLFSFHHSHSLRACLHLCLPLCECDGLNPFFLSHTFRAWIHIPLSPSVFRICECGGSSASPSFSYFFSAVGVGIVAGVVIVQDTEKGPQLLSRSNVATSLLTMEHFDISVSHHDALLLSLCSNLVVPGSEMS